MLSRKIFVKQVEKFQCLFNLPLLFVIYNLLVHKINLQPSKNPCQQFHRILVITVKSLTRIFKEDTTLCRKKQVLYVYFFYDEILGWIYRVNMRIFRAYPKDRR